MTSESSLVFPMAAMVLLSAVVLVILFRSRVRAVRAQKIDMTFYRIYQGGAEPEESAKPARHFANLFEAPVLFYAGCISAMVVHDAGIAVHVLAWAYVAARIAHAWVHLGGNRVRHRLRAYFASWLVLVALWIHVAVHVAT